MRKFLTAAQCRLIGRALSLTAGDLRDPAQQAEARILAGEWIEAHDRGGQHLLVAPAEWPAWLDGGRDKPAGPMPEWLERGESVRRVEWPEFFGQGGA